MTEKTALSFTGIRPLTQEQSNFFTYHLLDVFRQLDRIKGRNDADLWPDRETNQSPHDNSGDWPTA